METKKFLCFALGFAMLLGLLSGCSGGVEEEPENAVAAAFSVGYGQTDITPSGSVSMSGFGDQDERFSTRVTEPLYANAIAVKDASGDTVIIIAYDLLSSYEEWTTPTRKAIAEKVGIPFDNVMLHCSHTHNGPDIKRMPAYQTDVLNKSVDAAVAAMADMAPATMSGTYTRVEEKISCVRHYLLTDGTYMGEGVGAVPKSELIGHTRMPDNLLQMIKFTREGKKTSL